MTLIWAMLQAWTGLPAEWSHPVWATVPSETGTVSADPSAATHGVLRLACYALIFWIALRATADRVTAHLFLKLFALFSTLLALFGMYAWMTGNNVILGDQARELSASFVNRNSYATFAAFGLLANLAAYSMQQRRSGGTAKAALRNFLEGFFSGGWIWAFGMLVCAGALMMTQSRAGGAAGLIGLLSFVAIYRIGDGARSWLGLAFLALVGVLAIGATAGGGFLDRVLTTSGEDARFAIYPMVVQGIMDRPLLGHGLGAFEDAFRSYVPLEAATGEWDMAHNSYLENIFELGMVAAGAFYIALGLVVYQIWLGLRGRVRSRAVLAFSFACVVTAAMHAAFDFSLQMPGLAAFFAFFLGMGYAQSFREGEMSEQN
ncbi:O-antigen ligase family protein [uncultured Pelagimonas sp.]|uniref:O-antigen ligase family protein n=1 Tax=uncultured Pelagimonas sp. TaxID=1618102 RepID=UPI00262044F4|nr:O-antigen ligase family protein [uncultured Pelagimonas sp.]